MPRISILAIVLAVSCIGAVYATASHAATQSLALLETDGATPLHCEGAVCRAELSTFCLQKERDLPRAGDPYRLAAGHTLTLVLTGTDGRVWQVPAGNQIRIEAARSGHTAVSVAIDRTQLATLGAEKVALSVGERVTLMPVPVAGDDNPQTDQDRALATGPLRTLGAKIVDRGPHDIARVHALNGLINALPTGIDRRPDAQQSLWRRAVDTALGDAPAKKLQTAQQEYAACWQDRVVQLGGYAVRHCLQRRHDSLMWQHVKRYWGKVGAGS